MYREWKKRGFPKEYCIWIWKQQDQEVDQEVDGWMKWGRMEEAPENGKESPHSVHANGLINRLISCYYPELDLFSGADHNKLLFLWYEVFQNSSV